MDVDKFQNLLQEFKKLPKRNREKNIFSIGGRGYYENPTSDLLAFFLDPNEEHGFGDLVLSCLVEFIDNWKPFPLNYLELKREYPTDENNSIDLVLNSDKWVIALENKLEHSPINPFEEYQTTIEKKFSNMQKYFVILAPYETKVEKWEWVNYKDFLKKVRAKLDAKFMISGISKWEIFLREFVNNIEEQLEPDMDKNKIKFFQNNYEDIDSLIKWHSKYIDHLIGEVRKAASEVLGFDPESTKKHSWGAHGVALRVYPKSDRGDNVTFLVCPNGDFRVQFYVQKKSGINIEDFTQTDSKDFYCEDEAGNPWLFMAQKYGKNLESALTTFKQALILLKEKAL